MKIKNQNHIMKHILLLISVAGLLSSTGCIFPDHRDHGDYGRHDEYRGHEEHHEQQEYHNYSEPGGYGR